MKFMCSFLGHRWRTFSACQAGCRRCGALTRTPSCLIYHPQHGDPYP